MSKKYPSDMPSSKSLLEPVMKALEELGGSGTNKEICDKVIELQKIPRRLTEMSHLGSETRTEIEYRIAWAKTYLKKQGAITNSARSVWTIIPPGQRKYSEFEEKIKTKTDEIMDDEIEEFLPWKKELHNVLMKIDPFAFERLAQRLLRECGFIEVTVTQKSRDGGIDGYGKLKINGIFCFNVAFQCKRYSNPVGAAEIRDFRGSLTTDREKGIFITTSTFSKPAIDEASEHGKKQIDLIDGEELILKLAELGIGVKEVKTYVIDEKYFTDL